MLKQPRTKKSKKSRKPVEATLCLEPLLKSGNNSCRIKSGCDGGGKHKGFRISAEIEGEGEAESCVSHLSPLSS